MFFENAQEHRHEHRVLGRWSCVYVATAVCINHGNTREREHKSAGAHEHKSGKFVVGGC